jgi:uncharacterized repeat protein (TIGR01451 family)
LIADNRTTATCTDTSIEPGQQITCTSVNYPTTQANLDAGRVINIATAGAMVAGTGVSIRSVNAVQLTVPAVQNPALTLLKTAPTVTAAQFQVGNTVTYTYDVTNSGNVLIDNGSLSVPKVTITDSKIGTFDCLNTPLNRNAMSS